MVRVTTPEPSTPAAPTPETPAPAGRGDLRIEDADGVRPRLTFFKVMAFIVGVGLLVLVVEIVLSYGFGLKGADNPLSWWPQPHGFIYMAYLVATALLGFKVGWTLPKMVLVMLAGCVPFLSFWVERRVAGEVEAGLAAVRQ
jgi:integral membrane protein